MGTLGKVERELFIPFPSTRVSPPNDEVYRVVFTIGAVFNSANSEA